MACQLWKDFICKESRRMQVKNMHHVQCHNRSLIEVHLFCTYYKERVLFSIDVCFDSLLGVVLYLTI